MQYCRTKSKSSCPVCTDKGPLFPFEFSRVRNCPMCKITFHKHCFVVIDKNGTKRIACPVCTEE